MKVLRKTGIWLSILGLLLMQMTSAQAAMVGTSETIAESNRTQLVTLLEREDVQAQMVAMGVDPDASLARINQMTDAEVAQLNGQIDKLVAGAGVSTVQLLLIIILVILVV